MITVSKGCVGCTIRHNSCCTIRFPSRYALQSMEVKKGVKVSNSSLSCPVIATSSGMRYPRSCKIFAKRNAATSLDQTIDSGIYGI